MFTRAGDKTGHHVGPVALGSARNLSGSPPVLAIFGGLMQRLGLQVLPKVPVRAVGDV